MYHSWGQHYLFRLELLNYSFGGPFESLEHELILLRRHLIKQEAVFVGELSPLVILHLPGVFHIAFVADHYNLNVLVGVTVHLI